MIAQLVIAWLMANGAVLAVLGPRKAVELCDHLLERLQRAIR